jgi:hypothetical protein
MSEKDSNILDRRSDNIFMPTATKKRENVEAQKGRFIHYTSAENAMKIINSKRVWMRNAKCMNDYMEVSHGHSLLKKFFREEENKKLFIDILEPFGKDTAMESINLFDQWWQRLELNAFITSISEHDNEEDTHGRLSMWRAYSPSSSKAAIVLNIPFAPYNPPKKINLFLSPVAYVEYENVKEELIKVIGNVNENLDFLMSQGRQVIISRVFAMLVMASVCLKHKGFNEEKEWRIIHFPDLNQSDFLETSIETLNGVPQTIYKIPLEDLSTSGAMDLSIPALFDRLIIGPSEYPIPMYQAFTAALKKAGVEDAQSRVIVSGIPLRT